MPSTVTEGIRVSVHSTYLEDRSAPEEGSFAFAYQVTIANEGHGRVQLMRRHWIITDGNGKREEVKGDGVVGNQPVLRPGEKLEYTSGASIATPVGSMRGTYRMVTEDGKQFDAEIAPFPLMQPGSVN